MHCIVHAWVCNIYILFFKLLILYSRETYESLYPVRLLLCAAFQEGKCDQLNGCLCFQLDKRPYTILITSQLHPCVLLTETPPPGYISEDGEASDQQMNQSMDTGTLDQRLLPFSFQGIYWYVVFFPDFYISGNISVDKMQ